MFSYDFIVNLTSSTPFQKTNYIPERTTWHDGQRGKTQAILLPLSGTPLRSYLVESAEASAATISYLKCYLRLYSSAFFPSSPSLFVSVYTPSVSCVHICSANLTAPNLRQLFPRVD